MGCSIQSGLGLVLRAHIRHPDQGPDLAQNELNGGPAFARLFAAVCEFEAVL
jgi:hypothetical protein